MKLIESAIRTISPGWAERRARSLARIEAVAEQVKALKAASTAYEGARKDRTNADWNPAIGTADALSLDNLPALIARCRDLCRNTGYGKSISHAVKRTTVGKGLRPTPMVTNPDGTPNDDINILLEEAFDDWASTKEFCDTEGRITFWQMQRQALGQCVEAGEYFFRMVTVKEPDSPSGLQLQRMEVDQLDTFNITNTQTGNEIRRGIEVNDLGRPVGYWFLNNPVNDAFSLPTDSRRFDARQILHLMFQERPGQSHGIPLLHSIMKKMRDLGEYDDWELFAARVQACISVIINREQGDDIGLQLPDGEDGLDDDRNMESVFQPGMQFTGRPGEKIEGFAPTKPGNAYQPYVQQQQGSIGAAVDLSYEQIARDFSRGTYSSQRQGMLEDRRAVEPSQEVVIDSVLTPVWRQFVIQGVMSGGIQIDGFWEDPKRFTKVEWQPPGYPWIDPQKEGNAFMQLWKARMMTFKEICATRGKDWRRVLAQWHKEVEYIESLDPDFERPTNIDGASGGDNGDDEEQQSSPQRQAALAVG